MRFGRQVCGDLDAASSREWLLADGLGGYAMGTVAGLNTRRYHGLLVVATQPPGGRQLGLAALDPVLAGVRLATHEWVGGAVSPAGHEHLAWCLVEPGAVRWRWALGAVVLERQIVMRHGLPAVIVSHRLVAAPGPVRLQVDALCTWRDVHGERFAGADPAVTRTADGFVFEGAYRVRGPGFRPTGTWYRGARHRAEAERGLADTEDLFCAGTFSAELVPGGALEVRAWAGDLGDVPGAPRPRHVGIEDPFVVAGPTVVAGYPWFGDWSRDTMTSYEGLFLGTGRWDEGRALLQRAAGTLSEGMLANTTDLPEHNTADATLWFLHAIARHVSVTGDQDLAAALLPDLASVVKHHVEGTRFGIRVDDDGLLAQGAPGWALSWMDARVDGMPITARAGKAVEINALWINGLAGVAELQRQLRVEATDTLRLLAAARRSFRRRFPRGDDGLFDVVDGPHGDDPSVRPNQLLAVSLPNGPLRDPGVVRACAPLVTSVGLRSLAPTDPAYVGRHRGGPADRDRAYHQGTVWPWLLGPYVEAALRTGVPVDGVLEGLEAHVDEWGVASVSETADGDPPHAATGCPFQAWSVAELLRARQLLASAADGRPAPAGAER